MMSVFTFPLLRHLIIKIKQRSYEESAKKRENCRIFNGHLTEKKRKFITSFAKSKKDTLLLHSPQM